MVDAIDGINGDRLGEIADDCTTRRLVVEYLDAIAAIARVVPTEALLATYLPCRRCS